ncbi:MAG: nucleotidyltransferase family protein [Rhizobiales bacterium]|nr:nucleotidyltransferase family protein [Hyphomicrobiales bacterium]
MSATLLTAPTHGGFTFGHLVANVLAGSWRREPPALTINSEELARVEPLLTSSGAAGLAWNRASRTAHLTSAPETANLRAMYRHLALQATMNEGSIRFLSERLALNGLEPLIFKGWASAQHYALPHLRPFGDIDICVQPGRHAEARELLQRHVIPGVNNLVNGPFVLDCGPAGKLCQIDLHAGLDQFHLPSLDTLFARSQRIACGDRAIRILSHEDHLRLVAMHFLRHGGYRPLWLCDVAAMLETVPGDFDWDICFGKDPRYAHWLACVFELARRLLGARIEGLPQAYHVDTLPDWFMRTALNEWQVPYLSRMKQPWSYWAAKPWIIPSQLKARWPNPISATFKSGGNFGRKSRLLYQLAFLGAAIVTAVSNRLCAAIHSIAGRRRHLPKEAVS